MSVVTIYYDNFLPNITWFLCAFITNHLKDISNIGQMSIYEIKLSSTFSKNSFMAISSTFRETQN